MRALFGITEAIPLSRVMRDYRAWLIPLALIVIVNVGVLAFVVWPLSATADQGERRAAAAAETLQKAQAELKAAEQTRDGSAQAATDLQRFYGEVLPPDVAAARRITHLKLSQLAREHDVAFQRSSASPEVIKDSTLARLRVSYALEGDYSNVRAFIYGIETAADFLVIENLYLAEGVSETAPLTLTLELSTYYRAAAHAP